MPEAKRLFTPFTRTAFEAERNRLQGEDGDDHLTNCDKLRAAHDSEVVTFSQFLPLIAVENFAVSKPIYAPTGVFQLARDAPTILHALKNARESLQATLKANSNLSEAANTQPTTPRGRTSPLAATTPALRFNALSGRVDAAAAGLRLEPTRTMAVTEARSWTGAIEASPRRVELARVSISRPRALPSTLEAASTQALKRSGRAATWQVLKALTEVRQKVDPANTPSWTLMADYEQVWERLGYTRGRLLRSVPLAPGESVEVVIKSWNRKTERTTTATSHEELRSTEITGEERWSLAVAKETVNTSASTINPSAGVKGGVTIPVKGVPVNVEANLGVTATFTESLERAVKDSQERTQQRTMKSAHSLKSSRSQTVELIQESGVETTTTQKISNPNSCRSLTYHFFEVNERYLVQTRPVRITPALMVPLPHPLWSEEEVLCNECELRRLLTCDEYYAGFDAAKILLVARRSGRTIDSLHETLRQLRESRDNRSETSPLGALIGSIGRVVEGFENAPLIPVLEGEGTLEDLKELWENFETKTGQLEKGLGESVKQAGETGQHFLDAAGKAASGDFSGAGNSVKKGVESAGKALEQGVDAVRSFFGF